MTDYYHRVTAKPKTKGILERLASSALQLRFTAVWVQDYSSLLLKSVYAVSGE